MLILVLRTPMYICCGVGRTARYVDRFRWKRAYRVHSAAPPSHIRVGSSRKRQDTPSLLAHMEDFPGGESTLIIQVIHIAMGEPPVDGHAEEIRWHPHHGQLQEAELNKLSILSLLRLFHRTAIYIQQCNTAVW